MYYSRHPSQIFFALRMNMFLNGKLCWIIVGQTWLMTMIHLIQNADNLVKTNEYDVSDIYLNMPFLELHMADGQTGVDLAKKLKAPRVFKCHMMYKLWKPNLDKHPTVKIIETTRNSKDTLVSFYHHFRSDGMLGGFNGTWDQYFEWVKQKRLPWGDLFEHTAEWYEYNKNRPNSLVVKYEDIKTTGGMLSKLLIFSATVYLRRLLILS